MPFHMSEGREEDILKFGLFFCIFGLAYEALGLVILYMQQIGFLLSLDYKCFKPKKKKTTGFKVFK